MAQTPQISKYCDEFHQRPYENPYTQRPIDIGGESYPRLLRQCGSPPGGRKEVPSK